MNTNYIIGTHDSATGEKGKGLVSWLVIPFAKTQTLSIKQQFHNGVRFFDIRVKCVDGVWRCGHGLWTSKKFAYSILSEINSLASTTADKVYIELTYEGKNDKHYKSFIKFVELVHVSLTSFYLCGVNIKLPKWQNIAAYNSAPYPLIHLFKTLDYSSWHTYFPCPWFWNLFYRKEPQDNRVNLYDFFK